MIVTIRTDKIEAELGIFDASGKQLTYLTWPAHRQLAETIHRKLAEQLTFVHKALPDIEGIVVFQGPGSFTGLRIGISVANALAYSLDCPVVATNGSDWQKDGMALLAKNKGLETVVPLYDGPAKTTLPRK